MISLYVDAGEMARTFDQIKLDQLPFALSKALNDVAGQAQQAVQEGMQRDLNLHRLGFELMRVKFYKSTKRQLVATIEIDPHAGNLLRLVQGLDHLPWVPFNGRLYRWVGSSEVFSEGIVMNDNPLSPHNLHFTQRGKGFEGNERTFVLPNAEKGMPLVFQRVASVNEPRSRRKGVLKKTKQERYQNTRFLFLLRDITHTPAKLQFYEPITRTVTDSWPEAFDRAMAYAVQTAKRD
jgi:hypothetical protein